MNSGNAGGSTVMNNEGDTTPPSNSTAVIESVSKSLMAVCGLVVVVNLWELSTWSLKQHVNLQEHRYALMNHLMSEEFLRSYAILVIPKVKQGSSKNCIMLSHEWINSRTRIYYIKNYINAIIHAHTSQTHIHAHTCTKTNVRTPPPYTYTNAHTQTLTYSQTHTQTCNLQMNLPTRAI